MLHRTKTKTYSLHASPIATSQLQIGHFLLLEKLMPLITEANYTANSNALNLQLAWLKLSLLD